MAFVSHSMVDVEDIYDFIEANAPVKMKEIKEKFPSISRDTAVLLCRLEGHGCLCWTEGSTFYPYKRVEV